MEAHIGGAVPPGSRIRHINGWKNDNRPENLFLWLPGEYSLRARLTWLKFRCVGCDGEYLILPGKYERDAFRERALFCSPACYVDGRYRKDGRVRLKKEPQGPPDPDRWRAWAPGIASAARMVPELDEGPGLSRIPAIAVPEVPEDLEDWRVRR
jgi:hypothetical protein